MKTHPDLFCRILFGGQIRKFVFRKITVPCCLDIFLEMSACNGTKDEDLFSSLLSSYGKMFFCLADILAVEQQQLPAAAPGQV